MWLRMPPFSTHLALLEHDLVHGGSSPLLGARVHWVRNWLLQKNRQFGRFDCIVHGSNPILGALSVYACAQAKKHTLWLLDSEFDAWDYPLAMSGDHDDLMEGAGLPPMGASFFDAIANASKGWVTCVWDWKLSYVHSSKSIGQRKLFFAKESTYNTLGEAREAAQKMALRSFGSFPFWEPLRITPRTGGGFRQQIFEADVLIGTSEMLDGGVINGEVNTGQGDVRLGRGRWHSQVVLEFAQQSRKDIKLALNIRGWVHHVMVN